MHPSNYITKKPTIMVFDSGVGGLSIYAEVQQLLPNANYIYVFDNEAFPYGDKPEQFILARVISIVTAILARHTLDLIIIACNTASTVSLATLRKYYHHPIIGVIPAIKPAAKLTSNGIIGLLATHTTIQHNYTLNLIGKFAANCHILSLDSAELVNLAEAKLHGKTVQLITLRKIMQSWLYAKNPPDTVILGCTHFPLLSQEIRAILPEGTRLIDPSSAIARHAARVIGYNIDGNQFVEKQAKNRAYCLIISPQVTTLIPVLRHYGFFSLEKLHL